MNIPAGHAYVEYVDSESATKAEKYMNGGLSTTSYNFNCIYVHCYVVVHICRLRSIGLGFEIICLHSSKAIWWQGTSAIY